MSPRDVQDELDVMRRDLLGGRGPGASSVEVSQHTRARTTVGTEPVAQLRQRVTAQSAAARGDVDGLALQVAEDRARLVRTVLAASRPAGSTPSGRAGALAGVLFGLLLRALGRRRR